MSSQKSYSFSRQVLVNGIRDGIPIGLGYFAVSFSLGIAARKAGLSPFQGFLASLFNNASAGEYAAFTLIAANAGYLQVAIITLIANARYLLMSCALAQRFSPDTPFFHRFLIGYDVTDELFGITIARPGWLNPYYTYGAILVAGSRVVDRHGSWHYCRKSAAAARCQCLKRGAVRHVPCNHHSPGEKEPCGSGSCCRQLFLKLYLQLSPGHLHSLRRNQNDSAHRSDFLRRSYPVPGKDRGGKC